MNSAELKTLRELIGLSAQQTAALAGVKLRTWQYWEQENGFAAKPDVATMFLDIHHEIRIAADRMRDACLPHGPPIVLWRYSERDVSDMAQHFPGPAGLTILTFGAVLSNVMHSCDSADQRPRVVWYRPDWRAQSINDAARAAAHQARNGLERPKTSLNLKNLAESEKPRRI